IWRLLSRWGGERLLTNLFTVAPLHGSRSACATTPSYSAAGFACPAGSNPQCCNACRGIVARGCAGTGILRATGRRRRCPQGGYTSPAEGGPLVRGVRDGLPDQGLRQHARALFHQPVGERDQDRAGVLLPVCGQRGPGQFLLLRVALD